MTTSSELNKLMQEIPHYGGLYLYNQLKEINVSKIKNKFIVINYITEKEAEMNIMGHWVVLDNRDNIQKGETLTKELYYFGSYGFPPDVDRDIMGLQNTHEIMKLIDRISNEYKYNRSKNGAMVMLQPPRFEYNNHDFQQWMPDDDTCGIYSFIYAENPNFMTNALLNETTVNRVLIDEKLEQMGLKYGVIIRNA